MKPLQPDEAYRKTEVELEQFERASFSALLGGVPNYYRNGRDDTAWGRQLRGAAKLLAAADYQDQYVIAGSNPAWLNPADLLREFGPLLKLNRNYPGKTQYDLDFKAMVLKLLTAYRRGATVQCIREVLAAFTGSDNLRITEMFKEIGAFYDVSYRHTLSVQIPIGTSGISAQLVADMSRVQDVVKDLAVALDLAKPAHVGLDLTTVLPDNVDPVVLTLTDHLRIIALLNEREPGDLMLHQAPFMLPTTPETGLGPEIQDLVYQWYRVDADGIAQAIPEAAGGKNPDLVVPSVTLDHSNSRYYALVVDRNLGRCWTDSAILKVYPLGTPVLDRPPRAIPSGKKAVGQMVVRQQPLSQSVYEGATAIFSTVVMNIVSAGLVSPHLTQCWEIQSDDLLSINPD